MTEKDFQELWHSAAVLSAAIVIYSQEGRKDEVERIANEINRAANSVLNFYSAKAQLKDAMERYSKGK